ncbi:MAG: Cna B-type domain-containing protein, partial [Ruminococcaceae bacterium]|nr:Cna B-type domain-containing protein [Oscillospiraceae bacterium]
MKRFMKTMISLILVCCMLLSTVVAFGVELDSNSAATNPSGGAATVATGSTTKSKTATQLYDDKYTDVTLKVGGASSELGVDIVYIVGAFATHKDGSPNAEGDVLISSLVGAMTDIVNAGVPVNFGMVPFSSDPYVAMPLTTITKDNLADLPAMINTALATCQAAYDGVNMENALLKAKQMFSTSPLATHPERQHLVMVTSGLTYFFNSGANNDYASTVPVNFIKTTDKVDENGEKIVINSNGIFYTNKAWMRARTEQTNTYPIPKAIVNAYNASGSTIGLWNYYWNYIDMWARADIAAGDSVVCEVATIDSLGFYSWYSSGSAYPNDHTFRNGGFGAYHPISDPAELANYASFEAGANPLTNAAAAHAIGYERAMWEAYQYAQANIIGAGINFYPIYKALNAQSTNGNTEWCNWTDQYINHSFVNMLAGGTAKKYDAQADKTFFSEITESVISSISKGTYVVDYIGYSEADGYDFDFIQSADKIILKVGEVAYITSVVAARNGATASYDFTAPGAETATFFLDYYYGNGTTEERFVWTFGEDVLAQAPTSLTYTLELVKRSEIPGSYDQVYTNQSATLYPKNSDGTDGSFEVFEQPHVNYVVPGIDIVGTKIWNDDNNRDGVRPESITINLLADGLEVAEQVVTEGEDGSWSYSFTGLQKTKDGVDIVYTITEDAVEGYTTSVEGNTTSVEGYTVTNTHNPATTEITVEKVWDDEDDKDGIRPDSITVTLYANGDEYATAKITAEDGWKTTFPGLYVYENGEEIVYTVDEAAVEGYTTVVEGYIITNTHVPEIVEITNPASVTLRGVKYLDLNPDSGFLFTLTDGNGRMVDYAISGNQGQFVFDTITFTEAGTYRYRITEVDGGSDSINYDTSVYDVVVTVTENGENLVANVAVSRNGANYRGTIAFY